jgi:hypothetical protein
MDVVGGHAHSFAFWVLCIVETQFLGGRCGAVEALTFSLRTIWLIWVHA